MSSADLASVLTDADWVVYLHNVTFPGEGEKPDHEWIPIVAGMGCAIITSDRRMRSLTTEGGLARAAIEANAAKIFLLRSAGLTPAQQGDAIVAATRGICRHFKRCAGTYVVCRIHSAGSRIGEVQELLCGAESRTQQKYGGSA